MVFPSLKAAVLDAKRCLKCKKPGCQQGCPISNDIPEFLEAFANGNFGDARRIIARKSNLPAVCGRVCAHELQCQGHCVLNRKGEPIQIGAIEALIADFAFELDLPLDQLRQRQQGRVAVIGSGPAGLTVAGDLAKEGFDVTVFEAQEEVGGVLLYGIPAFRLPKDVVRREIENIRLLGVEFRTNSVVGKDITVDQLLEEGYEAVFIGSGTVIAKDLILPGRDLQGVAQGSYLLRMNYLYRSRQLERKALPLIEGETVVVIGAGNVAMDTARTARELGARRVQVVYRRRREDMPALDAEYEGALADGVEFCFEANPQAFLGTEGKLSGLLVRRGEGEEVIEADRAFIAIGSKPANRIVSSTEGIEIDDDGYVMIRERPYGMTSKKAVFAGGDVVHRPATVVLAMKEAKKVAEGIREYVQNIHYMQMLENLDPQIRS